MNERITDEPLHQLPADELKKIVDDMGAGDYAVWMADEVLKLRARVEGYAESYDILAKERNDLAIRVRELEGSVDKFVTLAQDNGDKALANQVKYNALRDAVRGFEDFTTLPYRTDGVDKCVAEWWHKVKALTEGGGESVAKSQEDVGTESPALKRKPKAYLTRHDLEGGEGQGAKAPERLYSCADCGVMRSKAEGGTTFTVCDKCWDDRQEMEPTVEAGKVGEANSTTNGSTALDCPTGRCDGSGKYITRPPHSGVADCPDCNDTGKQASEQSESARRVKRAQEPKE